MSMQWVGFCVQQIGQSCLSIPSIPLTRAMLSNTVCVWVSNTSIRRLVRETSFAVLSLISRMLEIASSKFAVIYKMEYKNMLKIHLSLELVESMIDGDSDMVGSVVVGELKNSMERFLIQGLARGCTVNLQQSFDNAWSELVLQEDPILVDMETFEGCQ